MNYEAHELIKKSNREIKKKMQSYHCKQTVTGVLKIGVSPGMSPLPWMEVELLHPY